MIGSAPLLATKYRSSSTKYHTTSSGAYYYNRPASSVQCVTRGVVKGGGRRGFTTDSKESGGITPPPPTGPPTSSSVGVDQVSKTLEEIENLLKNITLQKTSSKLADNANLDELLSTKSERQDHQGVASSSMESSQTADPYALDKLKYLPFYPKVVRQWVLDAKTPKGRFNKYGEWETVADTGDDASKLATQMLAQKALDENVKERPIPKGLEDAYRFGITKEEVEGMPNKIKDLFSFKYANQHEVNKYKIAQLVQRFGKREGDTGSPEVQERINYLTEHMKKHRKDKNTQYQLMILLSRRRKMMKYLKGRDVVAYYKVLKEIGVRDMIL